MYNNNNNVEAFVPQNTLSRFQSLGKLGDASNNFEVTFKNNIWNPLPDFNRKIYNPLTYGS